LLILYRPEKLARDERSSLFCLFVGNEEKSFTTFSIQEGVFRIISRSPPIVILQKNKILKNIFENCEKVKNNLNAKQLIIIDFNQLVRHFLFNL